MFLPYLSGMFSEQEMEGLFIYIYTAWKSNSKMFIGFFYKPPFLKIYIIIIQKEFHLFFKWWRADFHGDITGAMLHFSILVTNLKEFLDHIPGRSCFKFQSFYLLYHGKSPSNHHLGEYLFTYHPASWRVVGRKKLESGKQRREKTMMEGGYRLIHSESMIEGEFIVQVFMDDALGGVEPKVSLSASVEECISILKLTIGRSAEVIQNLYGIFTSLVKTLKGAEKRVFVNELDVGFATSTPPSMKFPFVKQSTMSHRLQTKVLSTTIWAE